MAEGRKDDTGKLRFDLIPPYPLEKLAEVYTIGARKYADRNWEKGIQWGRVFAAMMRHAWRWWNGEQVDSVDGQHHLSSVAWCAFALMEYERTHPELDDRPIGRKENELGRSAPDATGNSHPAEDAPNGHTEQPSYPVVLAGTATVVRTTSPPKEPACLDPLPYNQQF